jgi:hypothetical protein
MASHSKFISYSILSMGGMLNKPVIQLQDALQDIRSGMDDVSIMNKYRLSGKGLQSLFRKLAQAGIIKHLSAQAVIADLRSGISRDDLQTKYGLSHQGLQSLFQELGRAGLLEEIANEGVPEKMVININHMVEDIRAGFGKTQLMRKYRLSLRALRWVSMTLISSGIMSWQEIYDKLFTKYEELVPDKLRRTKRYPLPFQCGVYDADNPGVRGKIRDVSEHGLGTLSIKANVGDTKCLVIPKDEFGEFASFTFETVCRWITKDPRGIFAAGFEISHISMGNLREFQLLLHLVRFGNR